jgi:hypothetical protein
VVGNGKSRLDFFLISPSLLDSVHDVSYEDRLSSDFDHKEVVLKMGNKERGKRVTIYDSTINDAMADVKVMFIVYESLVGNLTVRDAEINENLVQWNILINEKEVLECRLATEGENVELRERLNINGINIQLVKDRMPTVAVILEREFVCNYRLLYEGVILGVKNVLMGIQKRRNRDKNLLRERLLQREEYIKRVFGENS